MTTTPLRTSVLKGLRWTLIAEVATQVFTLLVLLILARLLGPAPFGIVAIASALIAVIQTFAQFGINQALVALPNVNDDHLDTAFWAGLLLATAAAAAIFSLAPTISDLMAKPELLPILRVLALLPLLGALSATHSAKLQRDMAFKPLAVRQIVSSAAGVTCALLAALASFGIWSLVVQPIVAACVSAALLWRLTPWRPRPRLSLTCLLELYRFGISIAGLGVLQQVAQRLDTLLIGLYLSPAAVGIFAVGKQAINMALGVIMKSLHHVALPAFSRLQSDPQRTRAALLDATEAISLITFPAFTLLALLSMPLLQLLLAPSWYGAAPVLSLQALTAMLATFFWPQGTVFVANGKPHYNFFLVLAQVIVFAIAITIAAPFGLVAIAATMLGAAVVLGAPRLVLIERLIALHPSPLLLSVAPGACTAIMIAAATLVFRFSAEDQPAITNIVMVIGIAIISFAVTCLVAFRPACARRIADLRTFVGRR